MTVFVPLARLKALTRTVLWAAAAVVSGTVAGLMLARVEWRPSPVSSSLVEYGIAVLALPIAVVALVTATLSIRWFLLCTWPGRLGLEAAPDALVLQLGPLGTQRFDVARMNVQYPFELSGDVEGGRFGEYEAFLPEETQRQTLLPRIVHPDSAEPVSLLILRYVGRPEAELAAALRPVFDQWQTSRPEKGDNAGD